MNLPDIRHESIVLWGGYGWGNAGDELTLAVALARLRDAGCQNLTVLTPSPGYTRALFPDVGIVRYRPLPKKKRGSRLLARARTLIGDYDFHVVDLLPAENRMKSWEWISTLKNADRLYLVGGGYYSSLFSIFRQFLEPPAVANAFNIPISTAPLGLGPFQKEKHRQCFASVFRNVPLHVRDEPSAALCNDLGLDAQLARDDGFLVGNVVDTPTPHRPAPKTLGVNVHHQHGSADYTKSRQWWLRFLRSAMEDHWKIEGFCFHNRISDDFETLVDLFAEAGLSADAVVPPFFDFRDACRHLNRYSAIASTRFHAAVVAHAHGIPSIGVSSGEYYHAKMDAACAGGKIAHHIAMPQTKPLEALHLLTQEP